MTQERFSLLVLPVSADPARDFHVSLHIGPTLTPDGAESPLSAFATFADWTAALSQAHFRLLDQKGIEIAAELRLDDLDAALWPAVFPGDTPVRGPRTDTFSNRRWDTFPVKEVHDFAKLAGLFAMAEAPTDAPAPLGSFLGRAMLGHVFGGKLDQLIKGIGATNLLGGRVDPMRALAQLLQGYDEGKFARQMDAALAKITAGKGRAAPTGNGDLAARLLQLHQARRFYERPDLLARPTEKPDPIAAAQEWRPTRPDPDFHERVAHLADLPEMLRKLGLVIDVRVRDLGRLGAATALRAELFVGQATAEPAVTPIKREGSTLLVKPATDEFVSGRLRLGDPARYAVTVVDGDGSALKYDRYLWSLPRLVRLQAYGEPASGAPPALRAEGYTVTRTGKLAQLQSQLARVDGHLAARAAGKAVTVAAEDVTKGYRIEVWDSTAKAWFSLHERLLDVTVDGFGTALEAARGSSAIGGSNVVEHPGDPAQSLKLHEAMFGWSGWSLAAPRPGPRVRHQTGADGKVEEVIEPTTPPADPITAVHAVTRVAPGTLPRLRYGRSYSFRAWTVDLAGNVAPHDPVVGAAPAGGGPTLDQAVAQAISRARTPAEIAGRKALRKLAPVAAPADMAMRFQPAKAGRATARTKPLSVTGVVEVDRQIGAALAAQSMASAPASPTRADLIASAASNILSEADTASAPRWTAASLKALAEIDFAKLPPGALVPGLALATDTVTPPIKFVRWEPVLPPVVVARHRFSEAESVRHLVIRSGVALDAAGAPVLIAPAAYLAQITDEQPTLQLDWRATSERHLAPPKTSQMTSELHGKFDAAMGSADPDVRRALLAQALLDDGTLLDVDRGDIADPALGARHPQPGMSVGAPPSFAGTPTDLATLPRGDPLQPGEYVVHDVDQLVLPYLPDPLAAGITIRFPDAGGDVALPPLVGAEAVRTDYAGSWPAAEPYRLVLEDGPALTGRVDGDLLSIAIPAGHRLRVRLSSALRREELPLLGLWDALPAVLQASDLFADAAADGWLWSFTPSEAVTLVHAVPRPVAAPVLTSLFALRAAGETKALLAGVVNCHAPSTGQVDIEAAWDEPSDELTREAPAIEPKQAVACSVTIGEAENPFVLGPADATGKLPGLGTIVTHAAHHEFGDTRHRIVDYRPRGSTRFREYFPPSLLAELDARSLVGPSVRISVPSTTRPLPPVVHSVLPLFRWHEETDPHQPFALRRRRRSGLRLYLERPWYSSGIGERLAVLLGDEKVAPYASQWGADPLWMQQGPDNRAIGATIEDLWSGLGFDDIAGPNPRVLPPAPAPLKESGAAVQALGYLPEWQPDRKMWFVDVGIASPPATYWPFIRLVVARYQPASLAGLELSATVQCDFAQLPPERVATVSRPAIDRVRVQVSGPTALRRFGDIRGGSVVEQFVRAFRASHRMLVRLERRDPAIDSDLGWTPVSITEIAPVAIDETADLAWLGEIALPEPIALRRPGADADWRVAIEEWEGIEADPQPFTLDGPLPTAWRLIYADQIAL